MRYIISQITNCFKNNLFTTGEGARRRIGAFEMWCYSKLSTISWVDKVTIYEVLKLVKEKKSLYSNRKKRCYRLIGHKFTHKGPIGTVLEGTVEGRERKGRQ